MERSLGRILVVDDEPAVLKMISTYLGRVGYTVITSNTTDKAWSAFEEAPWEFVVAVLDGSMPGLSMYDLAKRMLDANTRLGVIAASGYPVDMTAVEALAPNRVMFLQKPFTSDMLSAAVGRLIAAQEEIF